MLVFMITNQRLNLDIVFIKLIGEKGLQRKLQKPYVEEFIAHLPKKANVLDVGCGSGVPIAEYLAQHEFSVTGVDGSKELVKIAKKMFRL